LLGFKLDWALIGETGVEASSVVEGFDVVEDGEAGLGEGRKAVVANYFPAAPRKIGNCTRAIRRRACPIARSADVAGGNALKR
jgi:hypothetical protein